jgi:hypothetical protein
MVRFRQRLPFRRKPECDAAHAHDGGLKIISGSFPAYGQAGTRRRRSRAELSPPLMAAHEAGISSICFNAARPSRP